jgi:hypothetical protein
MEVICDEFGINPGDCIDYLVGGWLADLASQQKLGLWTKRRPRFSSGDHNNPAPAESDLRLHLLLETGRGKLSRV